MLPLFAIRHLQRFFTMGILSDILRAATDKSSGQEKTSSAADRTQSVPYPDRHRRGRQNSANSSFLSDKDADFAGFVERCKAAAHRTLSVSSGSNNTAAQDEPQVSAHKSAAADNVSVSEIIKGTASVLNGTLQAANKGLGVLNRHLEQWSQDFDDNAEARATEHQAAKQERLNAAQERLLEARAKGRQLEAKMRSIGIERPSADAILKKVSSWRKKD